uniref:Protein kinase domain-containing protein n=1 Tax=Rhizophagus irregularis (strain DAOM 181602 / DAOM 197198 / MUCL 43194) TaxID=747089 RepID=U9UPE0_RHIID
MNNIEQGSNLVKLVYQFMQKLEYHDFNPIKANGQIRFISFSSNRVKCNYCGMGYSSTLLFEQKYCKYCLYLYLYDLNDNNVCLDMHIISNTSNTHCTKHESENIESCTQNIQKWCMNCSEILYFKQIVTKYSFDMNYYYERQNEIIKCEKDCTLCGQQNLLINTEFSLCPNCYIISSECIESTSSKKSILVIYLSWCYNIEQCIVCSKSLLSETSDDCQKWCSNCFTIYARCRYCLTTNIIFGLTNQSKCKKCERISFITIDTKVIMEIFIVSTKHNTDNHNLIEKYVKNNNISNPLKIYSFISNLFYLDAKYITYSNLKNNEDFFIEFVFIPHYNSNMCRNCGRKYSVTLLFGQKYCKYCLYWYIKFTKFTTKNMMDVHIITNSIKCTEHEPRTLDFCTQSIREWCINCSEISYFKQIITQYSFDMEERSKMIQGENCNLCGNLIDRQISFMCLDCYSVSSGYIESILTKKKILILYLPWWDTSSYCITCGEYFKYKSYRQKWCLHCFIIYNRCRYCLTTNIIFGFTIQSQCIKCKRVEPFSINGNHNIDEFLDSTIDTNDEIAKYMNNTDDPLKIYEFIKNKVKVSCKNIKMIEYSETEDFERIAEGGFGIIYKATWNNKSLESYSSIVAVKKFLNSQDISKDFINELKSFDQYHNRFEHIIKYYGITQDPETRDHMIIMQYADGGDLHNYLQKCFKDITWNDKLAIILEISRGVDCIHEENYIHRDLHSGNILSVKNEHSTSHKWHIGDLGLSRPVNVISSNNNIYGVIPYVAPEIFVGKAFSKESDIYSMGMIMWELTSGCKPFADSEHNADLILKIVDGKQPEITNDTPECFANLMKKCWDSDSSKRPVIKEIRKTIGMWVHKIKDIDQFCEAETTRLKLIEKRKLGPEYAVKTHPGAIYTSRLLNFLISSSSSISSSSTTSFNTKQEYISKEFEYDINDAKWSSSLDSKSPTKQEYISKKRKLNLIYDDAR